MLMVTLEIPVVWWWVGAAVWMVAAFLLIFKGRFLAMPEKSDSFPFSARQFFLMLMALFFSFALYLASFTCARFLIDACARLPAPMPLEIRTESEYQAIEQIVGLAMGTIAVWLVTSLLPTDLRCLVTGKSEEWKKWFKGAIFGVLFAPVILLATYLAGSLASFVTSEGRATQIALDVLVNLRGQSFLFWVMMPVIVFIVPYVEEMLFRGFLQGFLNGLLHPTLAVLCSSVAFALFHYSPLQKSSNFEIMTGLFVFSLLASKVREKEDSISASIGMHAAFNATALCLFFKLS